MALGAARSIKFGSFRKTPSADLTASASAAFEGAPGRHKSFGLYERDFLKLLMSLMRGDVRDQIAPQKNDHGPS
jgi:hypothetical protein